MSKKVGPSKADDGQAIQSPHDKQCFVVMPFGSNAEEKDHFRGWYEEVIARAVEQVELQPVLSVAETKPTPIDTEIRAHLAFDKLVVADLGGMHPDDPVNPNVMYEIGMRHAFDSASVIMSWPDQKLPFDIGRQRVCQVKRGSYLDLQPARDELVRYLREALTDNYFRPMREVGREAKLEQLGAGGEDDVLSLLVEEVREARSDIARLRWAERPGIQLVSEDSDAGRGGFVFTTGSFADDPAGQTYLQGIEQKLEQLRRRPPEAARVLTVPPGAEALSEEVLGILRSAAGASVSESQLFARLRDRYAIDQDSIDDAIAVLNGDGVAEVFGDSPDRRLRLAKVNRSVDRE